MVFKPIKQVIKGLFALSLVTALLLSTLPADATTDTHAISANAAAAPSIVVKITWVEHNVYQNNLKGMRIHYDLTAYGLQGIKLRALARFKYNNDEYVMCDLRAIYENAGITNPEACMKDPMNCAMGMVTAVQNAENTTEAYSTNKDKLDLRLKVAKNFLQHNLPDALWSDNTLFMPYLFMARNGKLEGYLYVVGYVIEDNTINGFSERVYFTIN